MRIRLDLGLMTFNTFYLPVVKEFLKRIESEPYLRKVNSFTLCPAGEHTERGGAVECTRRRATKRNPVDDCGPVRTKTRLQHTDPEITLRHF